MGSRTDARVITFGRAGSVTWTDASYDDLDRPTATFRHGDQAIPAGLRQVGEHQLHNAAAAAALALGAGLEFPEIVTGLAGAVEQSRWRMELHESADGVVVVNDSYNANPASMRAAIDALASIGERRGARTLAVLGEMRELGAETVEAHTEIGGYVAGHGVDVLLAVGEPARSMLEGVTRIAGSPTTGVFAADRAEALAWLRENIAPGDVVVVKASRGAELDKLAAVLVEENP
jgi:UDP-N-acetylmuramoyl-tripeptide--D-alanyl-D-alanine ligase